MKFNTAATSVLVLLSALELCSAVKFKETGLKVTDLEKVAQDLMDKDASKRDQYIFTSNELNSILNAKYGANVKDRKAAVKLGLVEAAEKDMDMKVNYAFNLIPHFEIFLKVYSNPRAVKVLKFIWEYKKLIGADKFESVHLDRILTKFSKTKDELQEMQDKLIDDIVTALDDTPLPDGKRKPPRKTALGNVNILKGKLSLINLIGGIREQGEQLKNAVTSILIQEGIIDKEIRDAPIEEFKPVPRVIKENSKLVYGRLHEILALVELCERSEIETIKTFVDWSGELFLPYQTVKNIISRNERLIKDNFESIESSGIHRLYDYFKSETSNFNELESDSIRFLNKATFKALVDARNEKITSKAAEPYKTDNVDEKRDNEKWLSRDEIRYILALNLADEAETKTEIEEEDEDEEEETDGDEEVNVEPLIREIIEQFLRNGSNLSVIRGTLIDFGFSSVDEETLHIIVKELGYGKLIDENEEAKVPGDSEVVSTTSAADESESNENELHVNQEHFGHEVDIDSDEESEDEQTREKSPGVFKMEALAEEEQLALAMSLRLERTGPNAFSENTADSSNEANHEENDFEVDKDIKSSHTVTDVPSLESPIIIEEESNNLPETHRNEDEIEHDESDAVSEISQESFLEEEKKRTRRSGPPSLNNSGISSPKSAFYVPVPTRNNSKAVSPSQNTSRNSSPTTSRSSSLNTSSDTDPSSDSHFEKYKYLYLVLVMAIVFGGVGSVVYMFKDKFTSSESTDL